MAKRANVSDAEVDKLFGEGDIFDRVVNKPRTRQQPSRPTRVSTTDRRIPVPASAASEDDEPGRVEKTVKVSLYLFPDDISRLDQIIIDRRTRTGRSTRRTELMREAIGVWLKAQR